MARPPSPAREAACAPHINTRSRLENRLDFWTLILLKEGVTLLLIFHRDNLTRENKKIRCVRGRASFTTYTTLAGVVLAAPSNSDADATIIWSGSVNITIPSTVDGVYLNVVTGATGSSSAQVSGWDMGTPWNSSSLNFFTPTPNPGDGEMVGTGNTYFNLAPGFINRAEQQLRQYGHYDNQIREHRLISTAIKISSASASINEAAGGRRNPIWLDADFLSGSAGSQPRTDPFIRL